MLCVKLRVFSDFCSDSSLLLSEKILDVGKKTLRTYVSTIYSTTLLGVLISYSYT